MYFKYICIDTYTHFELNCAYNVTSGKEKRDAHQRP